MVLSESTSAEGIHFAPPGAAGQSSWLTPVRGRRLLLLILAIVPVVSPWVAPHDDAMFIYPYAGAMCLLAAGFCLVAGRQHPEEQARWRIVAVSVIFLAGVYGIAVAHRMHWVSDRVDLAGRGLLSAGSPMLLLPALMISRTRSGLLVRAFDTALTALACALLSWALMAGELGPGHARVYLNFASHVFIACAGVTALLSSELPGMRHFSRAVVSFLVAGIVVRFFVNLVLNAWFPLSSPIFSDLLICLDTLLLCEWSMAPVSTGPRRFPAGFDRIIVDSLQPTLMMLGCALLGLFTLRAFPLAASLSVLLAVVVYALRTQAFYYRLFRERSQLRSEATHLQQLATSDALTGIGNRRWFEQNAAALLEDEPSSRVAVLLVDVDNFKEVNDTFGHFVGDELLRYLAEVLHNEAAVLPRACCARLGGDEFAALLPGLSLEQAAGMAEGLCARVRSSDGFGMLQDSTALKGMLQPTVSIGMVWMESRRASLGLLLRWADAALYRAKDDGRNCVRMIDLTGMVDMGDQTMLDSLPKIGRESPQLGR